MDANHDASTTANADPAPIDAASIHRSHYALVGVHQEQGNTVTGGWIQNKFGPLPDVIRYANEVSQINSGIRIAILEDGGIGRYDFYRVNPIAICTATDHRILRQEIGHPTPVVIMPRLAPEKGA